MRILDVLGGRRVAVAALAAMTGLYYLIVAVTNCIDTDTNRRGVAAVLSMRHTIRHAGTDWRAITDSGVALAAYIGVVAWEFLIALTLLSATVAWGRTFGGRASSRRAAQLSSLGWVLATLLWVGGFLTVGGEWFRMWANKEVNASSAALQNFLIAAVGLVLVHLPERDAPE